MRAKRFFLFLLSIALGAGLGVGYGWVLNPPPYRDLAPDTLRYDYKADYVLMTAEIYRKDGNLGAAIKRLGVLENRPADRLVAEALLSARDLQYSQPDLETLAYLAQALQVAGPLSTGTPEGGTQPAPAQTASPGAGANP
jgi:hypothetical protein